MAHRPEMKARIASVAALLLVALVALSGAGSAAMMAPDREAVAFAAFSLASGGSEADLCGDRVGSEHHCPFCHALARAEMPAHHPVQLRLVAHDGWRLAPHLHRAAQARNINHSPRAPPVTG
ncbi:hypothetical protein ACFORG_04825 [Lutimaribacter marinistellae]|uniref:DUF2946 domain-containing protein n=1 Tax=Lutimaribacter marinistellae TaxID=1820329 RepID=A0ABV7TD12_9RHOB